MTSEEITTLASKTVRELEIANVLIGPTEGDEKIAAEVIASALASVAQERETEIEKLRADEALALCTLSVHLTGGNAGTWAQVFDAGERIKAECERLRAELAQAQQELERSRAVTQTIDAAFEAERRADERRKTLEEVEQAIEPAPWLYTTSYSACDAVRREIRRLRDLPPGEAR